MPRVTTENRACGGEHLFLAKAQIVLRVGLGAVGFVGLTEPNGIATAWDKGDGPTRIAQVLTRHPRLAVSGEGIDLGHVTQ